jgi:hypothetical protein
VPHDQDLRFAAQPFEMRREILPVLTYQQRDQLARVREIGCAIRPARRARRRAALDCATRAATAIQRFIEQTFRLGLEPRAAQGQPIGKRRDRVAGLMVGDASATVGRRLPCTPSVKASPPNPLLRAAGGKRPHLCSVANKERGVTSSIVCIVLRLT